MARTLAFDGTRFLTGANETLREICNRFAHSSAAVHAGVALALPGIRPYKKYEPVTDDWARVSGGSRGQIEVQKPKAAATAELARLLGEEGTAAAAAAALGHIDYRYYCEHCAAALESQGERSKANDTRRSLVQTLKERGVPDRILNTIQVPAGASEAEGGTTRGGRRRR